MRWLIVVNVGAILFSACDSYSTSRYGEIIGDVDYNSISGQQVSGVLLADGDEIILPKEIAVIGQYLVVIDGYADSVLTVLDRGNGRTVAKLGRRGEGPGEFRGAMSIDPVSDTEFWVYDVTLRRFTFVDLDEVLSNPDAIRDRTVNFVSDVTVMYPVWVDSTILALGFFDDGRIKRFAADGSGGSAFGEVPGGDIPEVPPLVRQHAYSGVMRLNRPSHLLVVVTRHASLLEIFQTSGQPVFRGNGPFQFGPNFFVNQDGRGQAVMGSDVLMRFGYTNVTVTDDAIFAVFSGRTRQAYESEAPAGEYVHVFDWSGNLVKVLHLDESVWAIAASDDGRWLYASAFLPVPRVLRFDLDEPVSHSGG